MRLPDGKGYRVVPDMAVDAGWHDFLQHTEDYAAFCEEIAGEFIHHRARRTSPQGRRVGRP